MKHLLAVLASLAMAACGATNLSNTSGAVKITGLGSHDGELCSFDRAILSRTPTARESSMMSAARCAAATIRGWAKSTRCSLPMCMAIISVTRTSPPRTPAVAQNPTCRSMLRPTPIL